MHYSAPRLTSAEVRTANPLGVNEMLRASRNKDVPGRSHDQPGTPCGLSVHRVNADHGLGSCIDLIDLPSVRAKIALVGVAVPVAIFIRNAVKIRRRALPNLQCCRISAQYAIDHAAQSAALFALGISVIGIVISAIVAVISASIIPASVPTVIAVVVASALAIPVFITPLRAIVGLAHLLPGRAQP